jgi:ATPases involved in chromosome partitioning
MQIIAIANQKGGVGKTTTTMNTGAALAQLGKRVLLVDLDQQGNLTMYAGTSDPDEMLEVDQTLYAILSSYADPKKRPIAASSIIRSISENLDLLPTNGELGALDLELVNSYSRETVLKRALESLKPFYDFILLDCPPDLSLIVVNALAAANGILIPLQAEYLATRGVKRLLRIVDVVRQHINPALSITGISITMADQRTSHTRQIIQATQENFEGQIRVFNTIVKSSVRLKEAPASGSSILEYDPKGEAAAAYYELAKELLANG